MFVTMRLTTGLLVALLILAACAAPPRPSYQPGSQSNPTQPQTPAKGSSAQDTNAEHVRNVVNLRQVQLQNLYKKQNSIQAMQGELNIKLFITEEGVVQQAEITPETGNLSAEFIAQIKKEVMTWRFILRDKIIYSFKIQFRKM